jgi:hypothetical protein
MARSKLKLVLAIGTASGVTIAGIAILYDSGTSGAHTYSNELNYTSSKCNTLIAVYTYAGNESGPADSTAISCTTTTTESFGNMTLKLRSDLSYSLPANFLENSTLTSQVLSAYYHSLLYLNYNDSDLSSQSAVFNVTGRQIVTGNWTGQYHVDYVRNELVNISTSFTKPSTYVVTHASVYDLPDRNYNVSFTPQQRQIIGIALSNSTVKGLTAAYPFYVKLVYPYNGGPLTGTEAVQLYQVDGPRVINIWVDSTTSPVVAVTGGDWGEP